MPLMRKKVANLDSRFVTIAAFQGVGFALALSFASGLPKLTIPLPTTKHLDGLLQRGWQIGKSIRLGLNEQGLWIELILEKEKPALREEGAVIGVDRGYRKPLVASDGQEVGAELAELLKRKGKRSKTAHHHLKTELFRVLKQFKLDGVKTIVLEDLRYIKHGKRGTFSRQVNRLLSFWSITRVVDWLQRRAEELGIRLVFVSPYKTSQRCSLCGKIDSENRKQDKFHCVRCGHEEDADHNASKNLEFLGLAGINSFRLLQTS
jgi:IS605 OrfB family transposase